jgi:DNA modification methylase
VLDPFMGSGTTGEVSLRLKRKFVGYELNPQFCKLSNVRLQNIKWKKG